MYYFNKFQDEKRVEHRVTSDFQQRTIRDQNQQLAEWKQWAQGIKAQQQRARQALEDANAQIGTLREEKSQLRKLNDRQVQQLANLQGQIESADDELAKINTYVDQLKQRNGIQQDSLNGYRQLAAHLREDNERLSSFASERQASMDSLLLAFQQLHRKNEAIRSNNKRRLEATAQYALAQFGIPLYQLPTGLLIMMLGLLFSSILYGPSRDTLPGA